MAAQDTWFSRAVPVLDYIHEHGKRGQLLGVSDIAEGTGLEPDDVVEEIDRLADAGYLASGVHRMMSGNFTDSWFVERPYLGERGLREIGAWPSDDPYEAFLTVIANRIEETDDPGERTRLQKFADGATEVGKATLTGLLVQMAQGALPHV